LACPRYVRSAPGDLQHGGSEGWRNRGGVSVGRVGFGSGPDRCLELDTPIINRRDFRRERDERFYRSRYQAAVRCRVLCVHQTGLKRSKGVLSARGGGLAFLSGPGRSQLAPSGPENHRV
jgi:hypothetical protein